ncbi:MAG: hypothetical protein ACI9DK_001504, partial [Vicingaceae bacterium]
MFVIKLYYELYIESIAHFFKGGATEKY